MVQLAFIGFLLKSSIGAKSKIKYKDFLVSIRFSSDKHFSFY